MSFNHLIAKHGVLVAFNIAKRVRVSDVKKLEKLKLECKSEEEYLEKLRKLMMMSVKKSVEDSLIPGIIDDTSLFKNSKKTKDLDNIAGKIRELLINKKLKKLEIVYIVQLLLTLLRITNQDFKNFYDEFNSNEDDSSEEE